MDLGPLATKVVQLAVPDLRKRDVQASLAVDPDTPPVRADSATMTRVLLNLVNNAIQALEDHPAPRSIEVRVATDESSREALLTVTDNGPGVPAEIRDRIFDPYVTTKEDGTGLGLSIVAQRVRAQGGTIELDEDHSPGACFRIRMPAFAALAEAEETVEADAPRSAPPRPRALSGSPLAEKRVLVAEDDEGFGCVLSEYLNAAGATVEVIRDGQSALERALVSNPDAIVCDLNLPRLPGDALLARLRQNAPELVERVIFATGEGSSTPGESQGQRHGRPCLSKPFNLQLLVDHICGSATRPSEDDTPSMGAFDGRPLTDH
jgi:CheY-like chemotaxis protein